MLPLIGDLISTVKFVTWLWLAALFTSDSQRNDCHSRLWHIWWAICGERSLWAAMCLLAVSELTVNTVLICCRHLLGFIHSKQLFPKRWTLWSQFPCDYVETKNLSGVSYFPALLSESDIMPHPNPFPISLWNTPTTTKPLTPRKHGIMRAQVAATTAGCLESGHWGFAEQSAMILAKLFWHLFNNPFMFSSGSTLRIKTLSCRTARMMEKPLRVADCCIFCR